MRKKCYLLLFSLIVCFISCRQQPNEPLIDGGANWDYTAYVFSYHFPKSMYLSRSIPNVWDTDKHLYGKYGFMVMFTDDYDQMLSQWSTDAEKADFDSLCLKHNDTSYNKRIQYLMPSPPHKYLGFDLLSIQVISDSDFDEQHPAGELLNDIVQFVAYSPMSFIQNGYQYSASEDNVTARLKEEQKLISKPLNQCTTEDFVLILGEADNTLYLYDALPCCYLTIDKVPTLAQQHVFTVTVVDDSGKKWDASIVMDWRVE